MVLWAMRLSLAYSSGKPADESSPSASDSSSAARRQKLHPLTHATIATKVKNNRILFELIRCHSLTLSKPTNFQPLLVDSKMKRIGAFSRSFGVSLNGQ